MNSPNCNINRPGGFLITDKAIEFCSLNKDSKIIDIGCGHGATVDHLISNYGFSAVGIDISEKRSGSSFFVNSAENIPFAESCFDAVIMECSFSLTENQDKVLAECLRVLKPKGYLIISDMYALGTPARLQSSLGLIDSKENIFSILFKNGFTINLFEDFSDQLRAMWGQMIFDKGATAFYCEIGASPEKMKLIKCGYFLLIATKKNVNL